MNILFGYFGKQEAIKKPKYVQISVEQYTHFTGLEEQIKSYDVQIKGYDVQVKTYENQVESYEEQVKDFEEQIDAYDEKVHEYEEQVQKLNEDVEDLNEKLSVANEEIVTKEALVKQHSKVAEDAVSGILTFFILSPVNVLSCNVESKVL